MTIINESKTSKKSTRRQATVTKRSNVGYEIKYYLPTGEDGKRKRVSETIRGTKKNAELVLRSRLQDIDNREFVDKTTDTVNQLFDQFIKSYATRVKYLVILPRVSVAYLIKV